MRGQDDDSGQKQRETGGDGIARKQGERKNRLEETCGVCCGLHGGAGFMN